MITGFENYTHELTEYEMKAIVPKLQITFVGRIGKGKAISNKQMCNFLSDHGINTSEPRIRKMIHYLRVTGRVKLLMSNSKGYYIAETRTELEEHIKSLRQRISSIVMVADVLAIQSDAKDFGNDQYNLDL